MPLMFRRKPAAVTEESVSETETAPEPAEEQASLARPKGYTPSKKELGVHTPKRPSPRVRRPGNQPVTGTRKHLTKEERKAMRQERREHRRKVTEGMRNGDPRYLTSRDQGPERALVRDLVDARRTAGTWLFAGAILGLMGSSSLLPSVRLVSTLLWMSVFLAVAIDCTIICRKTKRLVRKRHPDYSGRMGSLYLYAVMRAITFRRLRIPLPRKKYGDPV